ncbi:hypothetical protein ACS0Y7_34200, partial [Burkholderia gladioli]|uniref:hypothetical protein n=1 Tax=Burkholderia gladioli TaxID=28095 RepID=UPI003F79632A
LTLTAPAQECVGAFFCDSERGTRALGAYPYFFGQPSPPLPHQPGPQQFKKQEVLVLNFQIFKSIACG